MTYSALPLWLTALILALSACGSDDDGGTPSQVFPVVMEYQGIDHSEHYLYVGGELIDPDTYSPQEVMPTSDWEFFSESEFEDFEINFSADSVTLPLIDGPRAYDFIGDTLWIRESFFGGFFPVFGGKGDYNEVRFFKAYYRYCSNSQGFPFCESSSRLEELSMEQVLDFTNLPDTDSIAEGDSLFLFNQTYRFAVKE